MSNTIVSGILKSIGAPDADDLLVRLGDYTTGLILENDPTFFERVGPDFFTRLATASNIKLNPEIEGMIIAAIGLAGEPPSEEEILDRHKERALLCSALIRNLGDDPFQRDLVAALNFTYQASMGQLALRPYGSVRKSKVGRRKKRAPIFALSGLMVAYEAAAGDFTLSRPDGSNYEGPFATFLTEVWRVMRPAERPLSPEEFVRKAVRMRARWRKGGDRD